MSENEIKLVDFLPVYSQINTLKNDPFYSSYSNKIPPTCEQEFPISTFLKHEFNSLSLAANEIQRTPGTSFTPLNSQSFVARFLSQLTPYNRLLVFHGLGTGKTCLASVLSETSQAMNPNLLPTLVILSSDNLKKNWINEIVNICTNSKYAVDRIDKKTGLPISEEAYQRRLNANIAQSYQFHSFERLAKELASEDDKYIREVYSNRIIVIDEAQTVRIQPHKSTISIYDQIHRLLHTVNNCKVVLLSATPMIDQANEIATLFNLLLPLNEQFNVDTFWDTYFDKNGTFKPNMRDDFKQRIRGLVSYVRETGSQVKKIYEGSIINKYLNEPGMRKTPLSSIEMSNHQNKYYTEAYELDKKQKTNTTINIESVNITDIETNDTASTEEELDKENETTGLYQHSRQASLFVAPDGSYGHGLIDNGWFIPKTSTGTIAQQKTRFSRQKILSRHISLAEKTGTISSELKKYIFGGHTDPGDAKKLQNISTLSAKYAQIIKILIDNPREKSFLYSNLVQGSGAVLLASLLELFGFTHVDIPENENVDFNKYMGPRHFILLIGKFLTPSQMKILINKIYNDPRNKYGEYIQCIIGSRIVSTGISFKATRQFHAITPWFNDNEIDQAMGRVIRAFSHDVFPADEQYIKIYRWCSLTTNNTPSIDFEMYRRSEDKDFPIKQIIRLLKEIAVDCALNIKRNIRPGDQDNSRECDYDKCIYQCDSIPAMWYGEKVPEDEKKNMTACQLSTARKPELINDTYNLYYSHDIINELKEKIIVIFRSKFMYDVTELLRLFNDVPSLILFRALKELIDHSTPITNKYGIASFLREYQNLYFLVDDQELRRINNMNLLAYYTAHPVLKSDMSFARYMELFEYQFINEKLQKLIEVDEETDLNNYELLDDEDLIITLHFLSIPIQEKIIETFIKAKEEDVSTNRGLRDKILEIYEGYITRNDDVGLIISSLLQKSGGPLRCYSITDNTWNDCEEEQTKTSALSDREQFDILWTTPYKYLGILNDKGSLKIIIIRPFRYTAKGEIDYRYFRPGQECAKSYVPKSLKAIMLSIGTVADDLGEDAPDIRPMLKKNELDVIKNVNSISLIWCRYEEAKKYAASKNISMPEITKNELEKWMILPSECDNEDDIGQQKILRDRFERWYAILVYGSNENLCSTLYTWFSEHDMLLPARFEQFFKKPKK